MQTHIKYIWINENLVCYIHIPYRDKLQQIQKEFEKLLVTEDNIWTFRKKLYTIIYYIWNNKDDNIEITNFLQDMENYNPLLCI